MCMCGEWMVYGDDDDNNGGSLILLCSFEGIHTFLAIWNFMRRMSCSSFSFLSGGYSCTPNSTVGHLSIFTSRLTFSFLSRFRALAPFYFLVFIFLFLFFRALISWYNIASGSNKITCAFISQGKTEIFLAILSRIRSRIFLGGSRDENGWIYADGTSEIEVACVSERASESWFNHMTSF